MRENVGGAREDLRPMVPRDALEEWLDVVRQNTEGSTPDTYERQVGRFIDWCEERGLLNINEVTGRHIKAFRDDLVSDLSKTTLTNTLRTTRQFLQFGVALEAVEPVLPEAMSQIIPALTKGEESSDLLLGQERAHAIIEYLDEYRKASREHALFLLLWDTGCRISGLRALDVGDFDAEDGTVTFRSRPDSGTRLKNGAASERINVLDEATVEIVDAYVRLHRLDRTDDYGREPLLTTKFGRHATTTVRRLTYELTQPCLRGGCPHDEDPDTCQFREHGHESKCPSSLSPHPIRTGRITDLRNQGVRITHVAGRVDAIPETIRRYYDKPDLGQDLDRRRRAMEDLGL
ncbi:site-specific integrase [Haloplanus rallus]|uniref:Site-specific integrase n=1 Tax=Haloplanus rallus TaxID=1816183 RepID=A0A6B9FH62_9EURY|nr:site-specific integrase [Haloplanus rallus]QGX95913.1 site-specific integrase [Haloplanus rallus]